MLEPRRRLFLQKGAKTLVRCEARPLRGGHGHSFLAPLIDTGAIRVIEAFTN